MSQPPTYEPTRIRRLYVRGYRSIQEIDLVDLPAIVVLHGENGAGKSNILRAMALPLRWLGSEETPAATREASARLDYRAADARLGIRRDDFNRSAQHEMQFRMEVDLGSRARQSVGDLPSPASLAIDITVQDVGDGIRWWASRAHVGEELSLTSGEAEQGANARRNLNQFRADLAGVEANLLSLQEQLRAPSVTPGRRTQIVAQMAVDDANVRNARTNVENAGRALAGKLLTLDRLRSKLLRRELLRVSEAYRRIVREPMSAGSEFDIDPGSLSAPEQIQQRLYLLATSSDPAERGVPRSLASRLADATRDSGTWAGPVELAAARNSEFREYETQLRRGDLEGIPLTNLGTGEQQLLILLLDVLDTVTPIVQIEEPEAHLHKRLMLRLAHILTRIVDEHDKDQIFIATHHHAFAVAPRYYDVTYDDAHGTRAVLTDRAKAVGHFYEPGPLWDALRSLVAAGLRDDAVLFRDESGAPVHAREVLASIQEEGPLARKFAEEMTKTILLSMREEAEDDAS